MQKYFRVSLLGLVIFGFFYGYISWLAIPNAVNKAVADTSVFLMGWSMFLSAVCYFWDVFDLKIVYRKQLGLIGFAFAVVHWLLSWGAFQRLFTVEIWQSQSFLAPLAGTLAMAIFGLMSAISNKWLATWLGGQQWRFILRTGYFAMFLVLVHVLALRWTRWVNWYQQGLQTPPSPSIIVSVFIVVVLLGRVAITVSKNLNAKNEPTDSPIS